MEYRYLKEWVELCRNRITGYTLKEVVRFQDSLIILFKTQKSFLQVVLSGTNPFTILVDDKQLPYERDSKVDLFNQKLIHSKIEKIDIADSDRIIFITMVKSDIYNKILNYKLILELIPHKGNAVLIKQEERNYTVIECWRYITLSAKSTRQLLPGSLYELPEKPFQEDEGKNSEYLQNIEYPLHLRSIIPGNVQLEESLRKCYFNDINEAFKTLFYAYILPQRRQRQITEQKKYLQRLKQRKEKKLVKITEEFEDSEKAESYKKMAELLKSHLHAVRQGMQEIKVTDYYEGENEQLSIPLRKDLTPVENMKHLFKKYRKAMNGRDKINEQISKTEDEIEKLERELFDLENCSIDFSDGRFSYSFAELAHGKRQKTLQKTKKKKKERFRKLKIDSDWEIFIGRTKKENDDLTCRYARPNDWWFHTRIFHGAHIILRNYNKLEITPWLINLCSRLAAYFSKAKNSENVPVDYTLIKYVTKPHSSPPGYVVYKNHRTLYANPLSLREASKLVNGERASVGRQDNDK